MVLGMKWGIRKQRQQDKREAKKLKKAQKNYDKNYSRNYMNAYNVAADKENKSEHIPKFNKKVDNIIKQAGVKRFDDLDANSMAKYEKALNQYMGEFNQRIDNEFVRMYGKRPGS